MTIRRRPRQIEKVAQQQIVDLFRSIGGEAYVLGTRRSRGRDCPICGAFVAGDQGTRQTLGVSDVIGFTPVRDGRRWMLVVEVKAEADRLRRVRAGRLSDDQRTFRALCLQAEIAHVVGGLNAVIAWFLEHGFVKADQVPHYRLPAAARSAQP